MKTTTVYRSSNGDDWLLATDASGRVTVIHRANLSSGGRETVLPVDEFLQRGGGSPEAAAVRAALDAAASADSVDGEVDETTAGGLTYPQDRW